MVHYKQLDNGIRLIVKQMSGLLSVTMGIIVGTGACVETDEEDGISHFIEHMMFKGTKKRAAFKISDEVDAIGAQVNAFTGKDITCYYAKSTSDHAAEAFEILSDIFLNSTFPADEMKREKGVIIEEISMNEDTPDDLCLDLLSKAFFGEKTTAEISSAPAKTCGDLKSLMFSLTCPNVTRRITSSSPWRATYPSKKRRGSSKNILPTSPVAAASGAQLTCACKAKTFPKEGH